MRTYGEIRVYTCFYLFFDRQRQYKPLIYFIFIPPLGARGVCNINQVRNKVYEHRCRTQSARLMFQYLFTLLLVGPRRRLNLLGRVFEYTIGYSN